MAKERLQKLLAHAGVASRRSAEELIVTGRVRVNGRVVSELGAQADGRDKIEVDGKRIVLENSVYYVFHKPRGMVATLRDPEGRPSIGESFKNVGARVYPVGRLDFHTSGVILVTNDGDFADALLHPSRKVPKIYVAKIQGQLEDKDLERLRNGVQLDDGEKTAPADIFVMSEEDKTWLRLTIYEGKNRQIHRMFEAVGSRVMRLARIEFAGITHDGLRPGEFRELDGKELERLKKDYVVPATNRKRNIAKAARRKNQDIIIDGGVDDDAPDETDQKTTKTGAKAGAKVVAVPDAPKARTFAERPPGRRARASAARRAKMGAK